MCALIVVIGFSGYQLLEIGKSNAQEAKMHNQLLQYRPINQTLNLAEHTEDASIDYTSDASFISKVNQSIVDLQSVYPDAIGWLTIPNTNIDYPCVLGADNDHYLHMDLDQKQSAAGTLFMDFRSNRDFSDFNTIIFGHHMKSGSMFGTLQHFNNQTFFEDNMAGTIFLANQTYEIDFIAFAVIAPNDEVIYNTLVATEAEKAVFLDHINSVARYYRDMDITAEDRIVTLSTCSYEFDDARMVLVGRLRDVEQKYR
jgi:sortase B